MFFQLQAKYFVQKDIPRGRIKSFAEVQKRLQQLAFLGHVGSLLCDDTDTE